MNTQEFKDYFIIHSSYKKTSLNTKIFSYNSKANKNFLTPKQLTNLINKNKGDFEN